MHTRLFRWSVVALLVGLLVVTGSAQQAPPQFYVVVTYLKALPGQAAAYETYVKTTSKKFYQELANVSPNLVHWSLARVMYKGIEGFDVDYISASVTVGPPPEPGSNSDPIYAKLGTTQAEQTKILSGLRTSVGTDVLRRVAGTSATGAGGYKEGDIRVSNLIRIKPGMASAFVDRNVTLAQPTMQEAVAQGDGKGWSMWSRVFPSGAATSYDAMGVTIYKDVASALGGGSNPNRGAELFMKANPGKNYATYVANGTEYSTSQRRIVTQLIALVERTAPAGKTSDNK
ncbi:MAG: hypothetical protein WCP29_05195 [Acidobacteriota bacterium]